MKSHWRDDPKARPDTIARLEKVPGTWLFPAPRRGVRTEERPVNVDTLLKAMVAAGKASGIAKAARVHSLRHSYRHRRNGLA